MPTHHTFCTAWQATVPRSKALVCYSVAHAVVSRSLVTHQTVLTQRRRPRQRTQGATCPFISQVQSHVHVHSNLSTRPKTTRKPYLLADVGEGITECEVVKWHVAPDARIAEFDPLAEVQSDKASVEISSRFDGIVRELACQVGGIVKVGSPLCYIEIEDHEAEAGSEDPPDIAQQQSVSSDPAVEISGATLMEASIRGFHGVERPSCPLPPHLKGLTTPAVRRMCREHGLDVKDIVGTGKDGRVTKEDVMKYLDGAASASIGASASASGASKTASTEATSSDQPLPRDADTPSDPELTADNACLHSAAQIASKLKQDAAAVARSARLEAARWTLPRPLTGIRKAMFKSLSQSARIPTFTFAEEIDVTELEALRKRVNLELAGDASFSSVDSDAAALKVNKVTLLSFLVKTMSVALREHPLFLCKVQVPASEQGSSLEQQANAARLIPRQSHDVSIALSTTSGLLTPTLRSVESASVLSLASSIASLQAKGQAGPLAAQDTGDGGTVTLSNIGSVGGGLLGTVPVLPPTGQLIIGALGRIVDQSRYADTVPGCSTGSSDTTLVRRKILPVTFAGDHRVLQGTELAALVLTWKHLCERPGSWLVRMI